jgi:lipopolysaccharide export system protein LptC
MILIAQTSFWWMIALGAALLVIAVLAVLAGCVWGWSYKSEQKIAEQARLKTRR